VDVGEAGTLRAAWDEAADAWVRWARSPGHDSYWRFHRALFLPIVPPPGARTLDLGSRAASHVTSRRSAIASSPSTARRG
jgi:hypothetical protein